MCAARGSIRAVGCLSSLTSDNYRCKRTEPDRSSRLTAATTASPVPPAHCDVMWLAQLPDELLTSVFERLNFEER